MLCPLSGCNTYAFLWTSAMTSLAQWSLEKRKLWLLWSYWTPRSPETKMVHSTSTRAVILWLNQKFSAYDVTKVVKSDNGPPFMVASSHNLLNILASSTERCILCGLRLTGKWNALPLERYYAPLLTRSNIWISSYVTIVLLPIVLWALPLLQLCLGDQLKPSHPSLLLYQVVKVITRNHAPQRC